MRQPQEAQQLEKRLLQFYAKHGFWPAMALLNVVQSRIYQHEKLGERPKPKSSARQWDDMTKLPDIIMDIRTTLRLTQEGLARHLGVSFATINRWEAGTHKPQRAALRKLKEYAEENGVIVRSA